MSAGPLGMREPGNKMEDFDPLVGRFYSATAMDNNCLRPHYVEAHT